MITYRVVQGAPGYGFFVVAKESGVVVSGPFTSKHDALAEANVRASSMPGNRVES